MEKGITQLQVLKDSLLVIKWLKGKVVLRNFILQPLFYDIKNLQASFYHVYRENNLEATRLSKDDLKMQEGTWEINKSL